MHRALSELVRLISGLSKAEAPYGVVTFLRTDIEGSSRLYQVLGGAMYAALDMHDAVLVESIRRYAGVVERTEGDSFFATFARPTQAVAAAFEIQRELDAQAWPSGVRPRVRIGIHTGEAGRCRPGGRIDARGLPANVCGRVSEMAGGGQVLLTLCTAAFAMHELPHGAALRYRGLRGLRGISAPHHIYELVPAVMVSRRVRSSGSRPPSRRSRRGGRPPGSVPESSLGPARGDLARRWPDRRRGPR